MKIKKYSILIIILFIISNFSGKGQINNSDELDLYILNAMESYHLPGVSACAVKDGEILWSNTYGYANIGSEIEVSDATLFTLASISKTFVGVALMQLWEDGLVDLDENINNYLPFLVIHPNHPESKITLRMLMTHTSGILDNWVTYFLLEVLGGDQTVSMGNFLEDYLTDDGRHYSDNNFSYHIPGTVYEYSNVGATIVAYIVEEVAGINFGQYCKENIFRPLGMDNTSFFLSDLNQDNIAVPYSYIFGFYLANSHSSLPVYPAGFLKTSVPQLARYLIAIMQGGIIDDVRILEEETVNYMTSVQVPEVTEDMGLLWMHSNLYSRSNWGHYGTYVGIKTGMVFCKEENTGVIVLANRDTDVVIRNIVYEIFEYSKLITSKEDIADYSKNGAVLNQNYPNPFSISTSISYEIYNSEQVSIKIFDIRGRFIMDLVDKVQAPGLYKIELNSDNLSNGIYYCRMQTNGITLNKKIIVNK
ncbi:serine hydrolase [Bacteroidota bacterium]